MKTKVHIIIIGLLSLFLFNCERVEEIEDSTTTADGQLTMKLDFKTPIERGIFIDKVFVKVKHSIVGLTQTRTVELQDNTETTTIFIDDLLVGEWQVEVVLFENNIPVAGGAGIIQVLQDQTSSTTIQLCLGTGNIDIGLKWEPTWHILDTFLPNTINSNKIFINDTDIFISSNPLIHGKIFDDPFRIEWESISYQNPGGNGGMVISNDFIYQISSQISNGPSSYFLRLSELSTTTPWNPSGALIPAISMNSWDGFNYRYGFELEAFNDRIYAIGGYARYSKTLDPHPINTLYICGISYSGGLSGFQNQSLPISIQNPIAEVNENYIWILGGNNTCGYERGLQDSFYAGKLTDSGTVEYWSQEMKAPTPIVGGSLSYYLNHLILIGGATSNGTTSKVYYAKITDDGIIDQWIEGPSLTYPRKNHTTMIYNDKLIVMGGQDGFTSRIDAEYISIDSIINE